MLPMVAAAEAKLKSLLLEELIVPKHAQFTAVVSATIISTAEAPQAPLE